MQKYNGIQLKKISDAVNGLINKFPTESDGPVEPLTDLMDLDPKYSLSPFYHDDRAQYNLILGAIKDLTPHGISAMFTLIINKKKYLYGECVYHFNPGVVDNLCVAIPELNRLKVKHGRPKIPLYR